jgi:predicted dehydrogenase
LDDLHGPQGVGEGGSRGDRVGGGNAEMFTYQARAFLDQVAGVADPIPACATFADALRTMEIIQAVVESAGNGGAAVDVPERN